MKPVELLHQKIDDLPESAYLTLLDYVEFLLQKYTPQAKENLETKHLIEELLEKRHKAYQQNPEKMSSSLSDFDSRIKEKYGWNE